MSMEKTQAGRPLAIPDAIRRVTCDSMVVGEAIAELYSRLDASVLREPEPQPEQAIDAGKVAAEQPPTPLERDILVLSTQLRSYHTALRDILNRLEV